MGEFLLVENFIRLKTYHILVSFGLFVVQIYVEDFEMLGGKCSEQHVGRTFG